MSFLRSAALACLGLPVLLGCATAAALPQLLAVYESYLPGDEAPPVELRGVRLGPDNSLLPGGPLLLAREKGRNLGNPVLLADGAGGAFLAWESTSPDGSVKELRLLRLDGQARPAWREPVKVAGGDGLASSPALALDGAGGVLVAWNIEHEDYISRTCVQRLDGSGVRSWETAIPTPEGYSSYTSRLAPDGQGGTFLLCEEISPETYATCVLQHVGADGRLLLGNGQRSLPVFASGRAESVCEALPDGAGGLLLVGEAVTRSLEGPASSSVLFQRFGPMGSAVWGSPPAPVQVKEPWNYSYGATALGDGAGGVFAAWLVSDPAIEANWDNLPDSDVMVQRLDGRGSLLWPDSLGLLFGGGQREILPALAVTPAGGLFVLALSTDRSEYGGARLLAQQLDGAGKRLWGEGEAVTLVDAEQMLRAVVAVPRGAELTVLYLGDDATDSSCHAYLISVDAAGTPAPGGPIRLDATSPGERALRVVELSGR